MNTEYSADGEAVELLRQHAWDGGGRCCRCGWSQRSAHDRGRSNHPDHVAVAIAIRYPALRLPSTGARTYDWAEPPEGTVLRCVDSGVEGWVEIEHQADGWRYVASDDGPADDDDDPPPAFPWGLIASHYIGTRPTVIRWGTT